MKFEFICSNQETYKVGRLCRLLNVSPSGYYAWLKRPESRRSRENRKLKDQITVIHAANHSIYGAPKIHDELVKSGVPCGKNRVARLMKESGLRSRAKNKFKATTNSKHNLPVAPNLLDQDFTAIAPNRRWVGDITYIHTAEGWLYLAVLIDLYNRKVVGWAASSRLKRQLAIDALEMAAGRRKPGPGLIHHTDRGSQYASGEYRSKLADHKMICSMSRKGNCWDNAPAESFFNLLKTEWTNHYHYKTRAQAISSLFYYIEIFYNRNRSHSSIMYSTPHEYTGFDLAA